jgi:hypothetical protein
MARNTITSEQLREFAKNMFENIGLTFGDSDTYHIDSYKPGTSRLYSLMYKGKKLSAYLPAKEMQQFLEGVAVGLNLLHTSKMIIAGEMRKS